MLDACADGVEESRHLALLISRASPLHALVRPLCELDAE